MSKVKELDLSVNFCGIPLKNPITTASGTFSPRESSAYYDLSELGAVITKGVASEPWTGNPPPRIAETYGGMLNAVGLQNPGVDYYIEHELPYLKQFETKIIANVAGKSIEGYCAVVEKLNETDVDLLEINISCPNVKEGGVGFGTNTEMASKVTRAVKAIAKKPVIMKLTPNVTDIAEIAQAVEAEGADAISLINTLLGMRIDIKKKRPILSNLTGGLSGPAVKPVALRMVYEVRQAVKLPIIGLGGIRTGADVVEFIMAGADIVSVGTAALICPTAPIDILQELKTFMEENGYCTLKELREDFEKETLKMKKQLCSGTEGCR